MYDLKTIKALNQNHKEIKTTERVVYNLGSGFKIGVPKWV